MKNLIVCTLLAASVTATAQQKAAPAKKPVAKPTATPATLLKNLSDSASYAIGLSVANFYKQQGIDKLNSACITQAIKDAMGGQKALLNDQDANSVMMRYMNQAAESKAL